MQRGTGQQVMRPARRQSSLGVTALVPSARDLQVVDSTLTVVGGDIHNHSHHYHYEGPKGIWAALRSIANFRQIYQDMLSKATPGTGMWLVKGDKFRIWLESNGDIKIFWGSGIPGAGKTVLASIVIAKLEALCEASPTSLCVCYVFFRYSERAELTVRNVLEVLVKQTLERHPECLPMADRIYSQHIREGTEPTEAQLLGLLKEFTSSIEATFYVLDALDEAPTKIQLAVVRALASLNVKLFITSRPLKAVEAQFPGAYSFTIVAQDTDIDLHITKELDQRADLQHLLLQGGQPLKAEISSAIKESCGGMFLHASLQVDALCECVTARQMRRTLKEFPAKIESVYLQTWHRILGQGHEAVSLAKLVLVWVLYASRSMTLEELEHAAAVCPDTYEFDPDQAVSGATLIGMCRGLITVEEESRLVRLVHYTAREPVQALLQESYPQPHALLGAICITHLIERGFQDTTITSEEEFNSTLLKDPLLAYASDAWAFHARESLENDDSKQRTTNFVTGITSFPSFTNFDRTYQFDLLAPLHVIAVYHLPPTLIGRTSPIMNEPNIKSRLREQSPLIAAANSAHKQLVELLLTFPGIQVNLTDIEGFTALLRAVQTSRESTVALLLAHPEIDVNLLNADNWSPLTFAACGEDSAGIVALLLKNPNIQINLVGGDGGWSALILAAGRGLDDTVSFLLAQPGIEVNLTDKKGWSALIWAAAYGRDSVTALLAAHAHIDINCRDNLRRSPLIEAALNGHAGITARLLEHPDIRVNQVDIEGVSALIGASAHGYHSVVALLLKRSEIDVNMVDTGGWSALLCAADYGCNDVVALLLAHPDIQVNLAGPDGYTAIMQAAAAGREGAVRLLLEATHIDTKVRSAKDGHTAESAAVTNGHVVIVDLLKEFHSRYPEAVSLVKTDDDEDVSDSDIYHDAQEYL